MFGSRIESLFQKIGVESRILVDFDDLLRTLKHEVPRVLILNLDMLEGKLEALADLISKGQPFVVGYYSHLNVGLAEEAKRARVERVLSRGAFVAQVGVLLQSLFSKR